MTGDTSTRTPKGRSGSSNLPDTLLHFDVQVGWCPTCSLDVRMRCLSWWKDAKTGMGVSECLQCRARQSMEVTTHE